MFTNRKRLGVGGAATLVLASVIGSVSLLGSPLSDEECDGLAMETGDVGFVEVEEATAAGIAAAAVREHRRVLERNRQAHDQIQGDRRWQDAEQAPFMKMAAADFEEAIADEQEAMLLALERAGCR